jgi:hypothetical protein
MLYRYMRRTGGRIKRAEQHMNRVEELLERLVNAAENRDKGRS